MNASKDKPMLKGVKQRKHRCIQRPSKGQTRGTFFKFYSRGAEPLTDKKLQRVASAYGIHHNPDSKLKWCYYCKMTKEFKTVPSVTKVLGFECVNLKSSEFADKYPSSQVKFMSDQLPSDLINEGQSGEDENDHEFSVPSNYTLENDLQCEGKIQEFLLDKYNISPAASKELRQKMKEVFGYLFLQFGSTTSTEAIENAVYIVQTLADSLLHKEGEGPFSIEGQ